MTRTTRLAQPLRTTPLVVIDVYDEHVVSKLAPGAAAQGGTKFKYMRTTLTARGRAQLRNRDGNPSRRRP